MSLGKFPLLLWKFTPLAGFSGIGVGCFLFFMYIITSIVPGTASGKGHDVCCGWPTKQCYGGEWKLEMKLGSEYQTVVVVSHSSRLFLVPLMILPQLLQAWKTKTSSPVLPLVSCCSETRFSLPAAVISIPPLLSHPSTLTIIIPGLAFSYLVFCLTKNIMKNKQTNKNKRWKLVLCFIRRKSDTLWLRWFAFIR